MDFKIELLPEERENLSVCVCVSVREREREPCGESEAASEHRAMAGSRAGLEWFMSFTKTSSPVTTTEL